VFVVDDDASVRESLQRLLSSEGLYVRSFPTAQAFLDALPIDDVPTCVIIDVGLPGLDGLGLQQRLGELEAPPAVLFLTGRGDVPTSVRAIKAGALDFFTKPFKAGELVTGVRTALQRERANALERRRMNDLRRRYALLSGREREVMAGVVEGLLNKQIAARLGTSEVTVKEQRGHVMRKMCADSAAELVRMGMRLGIFTLEAQLEGKGTPRA
jgi:FixJ family two-component response regulator